MTHVPALADWALFVRKTKQFVKNMDAQRQAPGLPQRCWHSRGWGSRGGSGGEEDQDEKFSLLERQI